MYKIDPHAIVGSGSFATIYLAQKIGEDRLLVAKVISKKKSMNFLFTNETDILIGLDHKNIIKIYDTIDIKDRFICFMDYYPGGDIYNFLDRSDYLPNYLAFRIFSQLVEAVDYLHQNSIIHRDIKLENILYDNSTTMNIVLIDFGISIKRKKTDPLLKDYPGSVHYAAPEILMTQPYTGYESDIWALGICLYILLSGNFPFWNEDKTSLYHEIISKEPDPDRHIDAEASSLIKKLLHKNPSDRLKIRAIKNEPWYLRWKCFS